MVTSHHSQFQSTKHVVHYIVNLDKYDPEFVNKLGKSAQGLGHYLYTRKFKTG